MHLGALLIDSLLQSMCGFSCTPRSPGYEPLKSGFSVAIAGFFALYQGKPGGRKSVPNYLVHPVRSPYGSTYGSGHKTGKSHKGNCRQTSLVAVFCRLQIIRSNQIGNILLAHLSKTVFLHSAYPFYYT